MTIKHKFLNHDFKNGFKTRNSILQTDYYEPIAIFIGTFNHGWSWNESDFFYGRDMYMWPNMANLFLYNQNLLHSKRKFDNDIPDLMQIFEICKKGKFVFADIIKGVKDEIDVIENKDKRCVLVNNLYEWKKNGKIGEYSDKHLDNMGKNGWLDDNVADILEYINKTKSIKNIYFTYKSGDWIVEKINEICKNIRPDVNCCSIFSPTGNGFRKNLQAPFNERGWSLTHCWVWNGLTNNIQISKPSYGYLDHEWLKSCGVNPDNF
ncbi:hypothetical protein [Flavobacterium sp. UBA6031]|uniref:hypothetical protein n=1 Tax=Flavobacterium sp. UBA6031 TaxID=1946551 RepID=UPI0025BC33AB|nr:hypothetical protein [Flavobacterium sp. UBA6031]